MSSAEFSCSRRQRPLPGLVWIALAALSLGGAPGMSAAASDTVVTHTVPGGSSPVEVTDLAPDDLHELVAPIALYPDDLLAIVLPASTYPLQIVQAARFLEALENDPTLKPDEEWDESVVALLNYPEVVELLNDDLDWTWRLGEAVVAQQEDVLAAVEDFRRLAHTAGNLRSDDRQIVEVSDDAIYVRPADPEVIYVPYYEPSQVTVYQRSPVYYYYPRPYPVYYYPYPVGYSFVSFAYPYFWGVTSYYGLVWGPRYIHVYHPYYQSHPFYGYSYFDHYYYYRRPRVIVHHHHHYPRSAPKSHDWQRDDTRWRPDYKRIGSRPGHHERYIARDRDRRDAGTRDWRADRRDGSTFDRNRFEGSGPDRQRIDRDRSDRDRRQRDAGALASAPRSTSGSTSASASTDRRADIRARGPSSAREALAGRPLGQRPGQQAWASRERAVPGPSTRPGHESEGRALHRLHAPRQAGTPATGFAATPDARTSRPVTPGLARRDAAPASDTALTHRATPAPGARPHVPARQAPPAAGGQSAPRAAPQPQRREIAATPRTAPANARAPRSATPQRAPQAVAPRQAPQTIARDRAPRVASAPAPRPQAVPRAATQTQPRAAPALSAVPAPAPRAAPAPAPRSVQAPAPQAAREAVTSHSAPGTRSPRADHARGEGPRNPRGFPR
jgi:hypothetical protein